MPNKNHEALVKLRDKFAKLSATYNKKAAAVEQLIHAEEQRVINSIPHKFFFLIDGFRQHDTWAERQEGSLERGFKRHRQYRAPRQRTTIEGGLNCGAALAPAIAALDDKVAAHTGKKHIVIVSDGDMFDSSTALSKLALFIKENQNVTLDIFVITPDTHSPAPASVIAKTLAAVFPDRVALHRTGHQDLDAKAFDQLIKARTNASRKGPKPSL